MTFTEIRPCKRIQIVVTWKMSWLFGKKAWFNISQTCRGRKVNATKTLRKSSVQKLVTYCQRLRWEAALPGWTHAEQSSSGSASWWEHSDNEPSSPSRSQSKWEAFLQTHYYSIRKQRSSVAKMFSYRLLPLSTLCTLPPYLYLFPLYSESSGGELGWVVSLLQTLQVQSNQSCQIRGFPQFEVKTLRRHSYSKDFVFYYSLPLSHITSPFISESCVSLRTFITSWQCLWFRLL